MATLGTGLAACGDDSEAPAPEVEQAPSELVEIPDVTGEPALDAVSELEAVGFTASYDEEPPDPSICTVSEQDVVGEAARGIDVGLTVECEVPDVEGENAEDAESTLEDAGFTSTFEEEPDDPSACTVATQDTTEDAAPGAEILLELTCVVDVPFLGGQDAQSAQSALEGLGLTVVFDPEPSDPYSCTVADQSATGEVDPGTEVVLTLECEGDGY